jgi:hypothetical protein
MMTPTDHDQIRSMISRSLPAESKAWHEFQDSGQWQGDVPRDVFQRVFEEDGHAEAIRLCLHPERPYKGVPVGNQPRNLMDAWERFLTAHRAPRSSP